ncbi:MAG: hypothetical protein U9O56_08370 [Campylobacterota bacterium]|nr:hypothetical protein [Campylobacterota bacterium]
MLNDFFTPKEKVKIAVNENNEIVAFDEWVALYQEDLKSIGAYNIYDIDSDGLSYLDIYEMDKNRVVLLQNS